MRNGLLRLARISGLALTLGLGWMLVGLSASAAPINSASYGSLTGTGLVDFNGLPAAPLPGTAVDGILDLDGASFAERFAGQTLGSSGDFDTLSGTPTDPLALVSGAVGENLVAANLGGIIGIAGLGPLGFPDAAANGEGSIAILFDDDTAEFGLEILGVDASTGGATFDFYQRDGTLIDSVTIALASDGLFGFTRDGGLVDIAGVIITNDDLGGIGVDNVVFQLPIPEPSTALLLLSGLCGLGARRV